MLAQWREQLLGEDIPVAWLTATRDDAEPHAFLRALMHALRVAGIDLGEASLWLSGDVTSTQRLEAVILALERCRSAIVIMVDAFEAIDQRAMRGILTDLIDLLPEHVHLSLGCRQKPSLGLATHLARGNVRMIGPDELRFDSTEMANVLGVAPSSTEIALLERTEGWPIAVQLHHLWWSSSHPDDVDFATGLPASHLTRYMTDEVFRTLAKDHQDLLADVSIFTEVEPALADGIRHAEDSSTLLEEISEALPGLVERCRGDPTTAYRLHPMIAEHGQRQLSLRAGREASLRRLAAAWFWDRGRHAEALAQAMLSQDVRLLEQFTKALPTLEIFLANGTDELRAILRTLPTGAMHRPSRVRLAEALTLAKAGHFKDAWNIVEELGQAEASDDDVERLMIQSIIANQFMTARRAADVALDRISEMAAQAPLVCAFVDNGRVVTHQQAGDLDAARRALIRAQSAYESGGDFPFSHFHLRAHALQIALAEGQLNRASDLSHAMLSDEQGSPLAHVRLATARIALSAIDHARTYRLRTTDQTRMALALLGEGDATFDQYAIAMPIILDGIMRRDGALAVIGELAAIAGRFAEQGLVSMDGMLRSLELLYRARSGSVATGVDPADLCRDERPDGGTPWRERDVTRHAAVLQAILAGSHDLALSVAGQMLLDGRTGGRISTQVKAMILNGLALEAIGDHAAADRSLTEALRLSSTEAFLAPFVEEGAMLRPILSRLLDVRAQSRAAVHLKKVVDAIDALSRPGQLTDREAEILAHLADGASNKLIARRLDLAENTVKFHMKNIFAKLGVTSRKQAAACAFGDL